MIRTKLLVSLAGGAMLAFAGLAAPAGAIIINPGPGDATTTTIDCTYGGEGCTTTTGVGDTTTTVVGGVPTYDVVVNGTTTQTIPVDCPAGSSVAVSYDGVSLGSFVVSADGKIGPVTIPAKSSAGTFAVTGSCDGAAPATIANVRVAAATVTNTTPPRVNQGVLARTGLDNTGPLVGIGLAIMVLGAAFVYGSRKPRTTA